MSIGFRPKGDPGATKVVTRSATGNPAGQGSFAAAHALCAEGETLVGGGFATASTGSAEPVVMQSSPNNPGNGWVVFVRNAGTAATGENSALTERAALMVSVQLPVPEQSPPQPAKLDPVAGAAVSVKAVPAAYVPEQATPRSRWDPLSG